MIATSCPNRNSGRRRRIATSRLSNSMGDPVCHSASPIRRAWALGRRSFPSTSTRTVVPGKSFATLVARVTPSANSSTPSDPSYTSSGGIPATDVPCRAICCWSLYGSAPPDRDPGRRNSAGSTSRRSAGISSEYASRSANTRGRTPRSAAGAAWEDFTSRESLTAAPVCCSGWFGGFDTRLGDRRYCRTLDEPPSPTDVRGQNLGIHAPVPHDEVSPRDRNIRRCPDEPLQLGDGQRRGEDAERVRDELDPRPVTDVVPRQGSVGARLPA